MAFWEEFRDKKANAGWDTAARSTHLTICSLGNESDFWTVANNLKELTSETTTSLGKTALGRIYELIYFEKQLEAKQVGSGRVTPKVLCKEFNGSSKVVVPDEPVSESACDMAVTIYDRAWSLPGVKDVLKDQDELRHEADASYH